MGGSCLVAECACPIHSRHHPCLCNGPASHKSPDGRKADLRTAELLTLSNNGAEHRTPKQTVVCPKFPPSTPHPLSSLFTHFDNCSEVGKPLSLFRASSEGLFCQYKPRPIYKIIVGHHVLAHPQRVFNNLGFLSLMPFETYPESNNPLDSVKIILQINYNKAFFIVSSPRATRPKRNKHVTG